MSERARQRLILALDFPSLSPAVDLAQSLATTVGIFKINIQLFTAEGPRAVEKLAGMGLRVFLDLKFHDIPNTVKGAVASASKLPGLELLDLHALGGLEMMQAATKARNEANPSRQGLPRLLAITILTSMDDAALRRVGVTGPASKRVVQLAKLAQKAGMDGVVASPHEIRAIRRVCGPDFLIVVPGIRPAAEAGPARRGKARKDDQARIATPAEAIRAGADYLVVGRPIAAAPDPQSAARAIVEEIESALPAPLSRRAGRG